MTNNGWFKLASEPGGEKPGQTAPPKAPAPDKKPAPEQKPAPDKKPAPEQKHAPDKKPASELKPASDKKPASEQKPAPDQKPQPEKQPEPEKPRPKPPQQAAPPAPPKPAPAPPKPAPAPPRPASSRPAPPFYTFESVMDSRAAPTAARVADTLSGVPQSDTPPVPRETADGFPDDVEHSETVGERGPVLRQDTVLHEHLEDFVHSKIVERAVHVKGFGAFGHYQTLHSMRQYTEAPLFANAGARIPVLSRFSLAVSTKGTPDTGRNVRGLSTKFYTPDGVFDLLCNHIPVFLVRDAIRFPESIQAFLPSPVSNLADPERFWGFVARAPEATHFVTWLYSDVGTVKSLRKIRGYSVNTYVWRNEAGVRHYIKYHWLPLAGEEYIDRQEATRLIAVDADIAGRDLWDTIASGKPVEYELGVQIMDPRDCETLPYDPLDDTKVWDEEDYPIIPVGRLTLDRNPTDYQEQIEKVAFSPANLQNGVEFSDDKMLQGRTLVYGDAQRYRLGPDFRSIPVNRQPDFAAKKNMVTSGLGEYREGYEQRSDLSKTDDFAQAGERYHMLTDSAQERMIDNIASELHLVSRQTRETVIGYLARADEALGARVAARTGQYLSGELK